MEVLERALVVLGGVLWGALGALGGPWEVTERSVGILGGPWWVLMGSLGLLYAEFQGGLWLLGRFLVSLEAPLEVLGGCQGRFLEFLGGARGVFWDPWGCLGGPYGAIGGLMKTLKNH